MSRPRNILVVYAFRRHPMRKSVADHLYAFERRANGDRVFLLNLAVRSVSRYLLRVPFDLVVFHTLFLSARWKPEFFEQLRERAEPLRAIRAPRAILPQDEFYDTRTLESFVRYFDIEHLFTVMPETELKKVYPTIDRSRVRFHQVLTGYLADEGVFQERKLTGDGHSREIDVGYRAWHAAPWLGRHGRLKVLIGERTRQLAPGFGLSSDISTAASDVLLGDEWMRFLRRCRFTVGVEGGASILDRDGELRAATERYLATHPDAEFEEVEAACFPGRDGEVALVALSPRHLEACAARTGQILIEGHYGGILQAGEHYIPVRPDLEDLPDALDQARDETKRQEMTERAHRDIVASGVVSYERFVEQVSAVAAESARPEPESELDAALARNRRAEKRAWLLIRSANAAWTQLSGRRPS